MLTTRFSKTIRTLFLGCFLLMGNQETQTMSFAHSLTRNLQSFVSTHPRLTRAGVLGGALVGGYFLYRWLTNKNNGLNEKLIKKIAGRFRTERHDAIEAALSARDLGIPSEILGLMEAYEYQLMGKVVAVVDLDDTPPFLYPFGFQQHIEDYINGVITHVMAVLPNGRVATGSNRIKIWDLTTGRRIAVFASEAWEVYNLVVLPENKLAYSTYDGIIKIWSLPTETTAAICEHTMRTGARTLLAVLQDGTLLSIDQETINPEIKLWNSTSGALIKSIHIQIPSTCTSLLVLPDNRVACGAANGRIVIWDVTQGEQGKLLKTLQGEGAINHIAILANGDLVAATSQDILQIWNAQNVAPFHLPANAPDNLQEDIINLAARLDQHAPVAPHRRIQTGHTKIISSLVALPDSSLLTASLDGSMKIWDITSGECINRIERKHFWRQEAEIIDQVALLPDNRIVSLVDLTNLVIWS